MGFLRVVTDMYVSGFASSFATVYSHHKFEHYHFILAPI